MRTRGDTCRWLPALLLGLAAGGCREGERGPGVRTTAAPAPARAGRFVSADGSDDHDGASPAAAWKSVAKVNAASAPGEAVRFRRGDVFSGTALRPKPGQSFDVHGDGEAPATLAAGKAGEAVLVADAADVTLRRLRLDGGDGEASPAVGLRLRGSVDRLRVEDVELRGGQQNVISAADTSGKDLAFERCRFAGSWRDGVHLFGRAAFAFRRCAWSRTGVANRSGAADPISAHDDVTFAVEDSEFRDCQRGAGLSVQRGEVRFDRCLVVTSGEAGGDVHVFALDSGAGTMRVINCVVILRGPGPRVAFLAKAGTLDVRHCTVIDDTGHAGSIAFADAGTGSRALRVTNCIGVAAGATGAHVAVPAGDRYEGSGNCFWPDGPRFVRDFKPSAFAAWSSSEDRASMCRDPRFSKVSGAAAAADAVPAKESPCRGAGVDAGVTDDHAGRPRPKDRPPAIGAFEPDS